MVEYSLETVLEFDDLELAYDDAASRAGDIESYEEIFHDRDGIRIDARNPKSITEAYIAGRRLFIANTDWPVEADRRTFFESIQILAEADPSP